MSGTETETVRIRDLPADERRQYLLDQMYAKLDDVDLPGHAYARITASITAMEKLIEKGEDDGSESIAELGPAFAALPPEHATELLIGEIRRLELASAGYRDQLVELVGEEAAAEALA